MAKCLAVLALLLGLSFVPTFAQDGATNSSEVATKVEPYRLLVPKNAQAEVERANAASARVALKLSSVSPSLLEVKYEKDRTQGVVIHAGFVDAECESVLEEKDWLDRFDGDVSLTYLVRSAPKDLGAYRVIIEHFHVKDIGKLKLATYSFDSPKTYEKHKVSLPGLLAGTNLFQLKVAIKNAQGVEELSAGDAHIVLVHQEPIQGMVALADRQDRSIQSGTLKLHRSKVSTDIGFFVTEAVAPSNVTLSLRRRGFRSFAASPGGSPFIDRERSARTWKTIFETTLGGKHPEKPGFKLYQDDSNRWILSFVHQSSVSGAHLPFRDQQRYSLALSHPSYPKPLGVFEGEIVGSIDAQGKSTWSFVWDGEEVLNPASKEN